MEYEADIMVNDAAIIELKSVRRIVIAHACPVKFFTPLNHAFFFCLAGACQ
ncbi:MAG: hypothetical protein JRJ46_01150 [Deltaproteobacteria bacterium]|nr:hypothetical protein [Deltaproteobacteria bacterium]